MRYNAVVLNMRFNSLMHRSRLCTRICLCWGSAPSEQAVSFMAELHHHHWIAVLSRGWVKSSPCRLQVSLSCAVLSQIVYPPPLYLPRSSFHRLADLPCRLFLSYGLQLVTREVNRSSLRRLTCPAQDHFICITLPIISRHVVLSLTQMLVCLSLYVILSILVSMLVCAAASLFCACLVSVRISAPYAIADITLELYIRMFRQTTWLFFKITRCVADVAQPATILRCIYLSWFFSLRFLCCPKYVAFDIFNQHIVHVDCGHHTCLCDVHRQTHSPNFNG